MQRASMHCIAVMGRVGERVQLATIHFRIGDFHFAHAMFIFFGSTIVVQWEKMTDP